MNRGIFARLLGANIVVAISALAVLGFFVDRMLEDRALDSLRDRLAAEASSAREAVASDPRRLDRTIARISDATGTRLTVVGLDGEVLADSERDPATMENHLDRPEIAAALSGEIGSAQRVSESIGQPFLYVAPPSGGDVIVRAALPAAMVQRQIADIRRSVVLGFVVIGVFVVLLTAAVARAISRPILRLAAQVPLVAEGSVTRVDVKGPIEVRRLTSAVNALAAESAKRLADIEAEASLREQILGAMAEGVVLIDTGRVVFANPAAYEILGARTGAPPPPELALPVDDGAGISFETHHPGHRFVRATALALDGGRTLVVAQDVTLSARVDQMRKDFVADASHELKTPVAAMRAAAESILVAVDDDAASAKRFAGQLVDQCERLSTLVQDLLDLARLEQEAGELTPVDVGSVAREEVAIATTRPDAGHLRITLDGADAPLIVRGRASDLHLVLRNLLDNAIRYTRDGGSIRVSAEQTESAVRLSVEDTGPGIPSKDLPRIFERFYRVDSSRARGTGGSGLGLAIVKHVVEQHGGIVEAHSDLGVGSRFSVQIPLAEAG